jgi:uncharacterized protein YjiS (DUF1127 family)
MPIPAEIYLDTPTAAPHVGLAARCAERLGAWRQKRRWVREMRNAAALGRLDDVLDDIGMTYAELDELMAAPADAGRQFGVLADMTGVDLGRLPAAAVHEAIWKCARCPARTPCKRWLRGAGWNYAGDPRCPNAALLRR